METPTIDLRTCKPGQKLKSKHGRILTYLGDSKDGSPFPHRVQFEDGGYGSRTDDGFVYSRPAARLETDHDIVEILS